MINQYWDIDFPFYSNQKFTSNGTTYLGFDVDFDLMTETSFIRYDGIDRAVLVSEIPGIWYDENGNSFPYKINPLKTVTFETPPTGDLLTWLQANAVKQ